LSLDKEMLQDARHIPTASDNKLLLHAYRSNRFRNQPALRRQHVNLPQLRNNLLGRVSLPRHIDPPWCQKTYFKSDHFNEGGSGNTSLHKSADASANRAAMTARLLWIFEL
jgi:hypothetical protein